MHSGCAKQNFRILANPFGGPKIMLAFTSLKHQITDLEEITDLYRRMGPTVNKILHYANYLEPTNYPPKLFTGDHMLTGPLHEMGNSYGWAFR
jgi:hypothetical protein